MRQLLTSDDAVVTPKQHTKPCADCPWARKALPGWLGPCTADEWVQIAHADVTVDCHTCASPDGGSHQCAGVAIYRANVCKLAYAPQLKLSPDRELVFSSPMEFKQHHTRKPKLKK